MIWIIIGIIGGLILVIFMSFVVYGLVGESKDREIQRKKEWEKIANKSWREMIAINHEYEGGFKYHLKDFQYSCKYLKYHFAKEEFKKLSIDDNEFKNIFNVSNFVLCNIFDKRYINKNEYGTNSKTGQFKIEEIHWSRCFSGYVLDKELFEKIVQLFEKRDLEMNRRNLMKSRGQIPKNKNNDDDWMNLPMQNPF